MSEKTCKGCGQLLHLDLFTKDPRNKDGRTARCKSCKSKYYKGYIKLCRSSQEYVEMRRKQQREYAKNNTNYKEWTREYKRKRRQLPDHRITNNVSRAIRTSLNQSKNGRRWETLVGYNLSQLKEHLEKQFTEGMTWNNYGEWHIDHIRPICSFSITSNDCEDFKQCWSLSNLQPLWAIDNQSKSGKWI